MVTIAKKNSKTTRDFIENYGETMGWSSMIDLEVKFGVTFMVIAVIAIAMVVLNLYKSEYNPYNFGYISIYKWDCTPQEGIGEGIGGSLHFR